MSDDRLLQSRRAWEAGGDPRDRAAWLSERLRAGELDRERVVLAAYCGDPAARELATPEAPADLEAWFAGLRQFGEVVQLRGLLEAVAVGLPVWEVEYPEDTEAGEILDALRADLDRPVEAAASEESAGLQGVQALVQRVGAFAFRTEPEPEGAALRFLEALSSVAVRLRRRHEPLGQPLRRQAEAQDPRGIGPLAAAVQVTNAQAARGWASRRLIAWALGEEA